MIGQKLLSAVIHSPTIVLLVWAFMLIFCDPPLVVHAGFMIVLAIAFAIEERAKWIARGQRRGRSPA